MRTHRGGRCSEACAAGGGRADAFGPLRARRYFREGFQRATADLVERELQRFERPEEIEIFFSAHGVPVSYVEQARRGRRSPPCVSRSACGAVGMQWQ